MYEQLSFIYIYYSRNKSVWQPPFSFQGCSHKPPYRPLYMHQCNTIGQPSCFVSFATQTARPLLKLKCSVLLVMYSWLNRFYRVKKSKYSVTLLFFGNNSRCASLLSPLRGPLPSIVSIECLTEKLKSSRICLIGYSGFISRKWL